MQLNTAWLKKFTSGVHFHLASLVIASAGKQPSPIDGDNKERTVDRVNFAQWPQDSKERNQRSPGTMVKHCWHEE